MAQIWEHYGCYWSCTGSVFESVDKMMENWKNHKKLKDIGLCPGNIWYENMLCWLTNVPYSAIPQTQWKSGGMFAWIHCVTWRQCQARIESDALKIAQYTKRVSKEVSILRPGKPWESKKWQDIKNDFLEDTLQAAQVLVSLRVPVEYIYIPLYIRKDYWCRPAHHPGPVHIQSQETGRENHCRPLTPWT